MLQYIPDLTHRTFLVIGDCLLDRYVHGSIDRISPEAPVPIVSVSRQHASPGGAANVALGLSSLGAKVCLAGIIGMDKEGDSLTEELVSKSIDSRYLFRCPDVRTVCKTRVIADRGQQIVRLDEDGSSADREHYSNALADKVLERLKSYDAVILSDYNKGTLTDSVINKLLITAKRLEIPSIVDPKKTSLSVYSHAAVVTPNRAELERSARKSLPNLDDVRSAAEVERATNSCKYLVCTCGADGMIVTGQEISRHIPAHVRNVSDVTGAGDTVVAILAACVAEKWNIEDACRLASTAAGIAVSHPHVHVVTKAELEGAYGGRDSKVISLNDALGKVSSYRRRGARIVFTNGCFDVFHAGHLACLEQAKRLGDLLIVGLNSDASVRRLKGDARPRTPERDRGAILAALTCVDIVIVFGEDTPQSLIQALRPDVLAKGADYKESEVVGADYVRSYGGRVELMPLAEGVSTTSILGRP